MTALLTAAEAQARGVGVDLDADTLQAIIDAEDAQMIARFGAHGDGVSSVTELASNQRGRVFLRRPALSISSIGVASYPGGTTTALDAANYHAWLDRGQIDLYPAILPACSPTYPSATVVYIPSDDRAIRKQILLDIVRIGLEQTSSSVGGSISGLGYSITSNAKSADWDTARAQQYRRLGYFEV